MTLPSFELRSFCIQDFLNVFYIPQGIPMWKIENTDELSNFIQTLKTCDQIDFEKIELNFIKKNKNQNPR